MTEKKYDWKKKFVTKKKILFYFLVLRRDGGGTFRLHFQNLQKIWW